MTENNTTTQDKDKPVICQVCGSELVSAKKAIPYDGSLSYDGSFTYGNKICPKCHPDFVDAE